MNRVVVIIKWISHYRKPFYETLKIMLNDNDIELVLIYGEPTNKPDAAKKDWVDIPWGIKVHNRGFGGGLIWQPALKYLKNADLIIVEQANKLLLNYYLQLTRLLNGPKIAFWGHGRNFQSTNSVISSIKEKWKAALLLQVDWWFAYNTLCAKEISSRGFLSNRITSVENAVDTADIKNKSNNISLENINSFKKKYKLESANNIAVFCGGMFAEKRLPFLLSAAVEIRKEITDFELIFIGAGIEQDCVVEAAKEYSWIHYLGPLFGVDKIIAMKSAQVYLMPGLIGLGVLDAFALGLPVLTTDYRYHSPEISYVENGFNGIIAKDDLRDYVNVVVRLLNDKELMRKLINGCKKSSELYTIENMASNFSDGVIKCLSTRK